MNNATHIEITPEDIAKAATKPTWITPEDCARTRVLLAKTEAMSCSRCGEVGKNMSHHQFRPSLRGYDVVGYYTCEVK